MSRAAILPFPGDPFLLNYWLNLYDNVWGSEINTLYVYMNSPIEMDVVEYCRKRCEKSKNVVFIYHNEQKEHGWVIDQTLNWVKEDYVMLCEDDGFVFRSGMVDQCFQALESGQFDIVGSKRGSCSQQILEEAKKRWGLSYDGIGDQGCNFWPCFFFTSRHLLSITDRNFGARAWNRGETIEALDCVATDEVVVGDTFVNTSLQLRNIVQESRIKYVHQYHGHPDDAAHWNDHRWLFDGMANWCHIGSLSTGVGGVLCDDQNRPLTRRLIDQPQPYNPHLASAPKTDFEKREWERRVQWWLRFWLDRDPVQIIDFTEEYICAIDRIIANFELSRFAIDERQRIYNRAFGL